MTTLENTASTQDKTAHALISAQFTDVLNTLGSFKSQISMLASQVKSLEKTQAIYYLGMQ